MGSSSLFVRFALGNEKCLGVLRAADFVDKAIRIVNPSAPVTIPTFQLIRVLHSIVKKWYNRGYENFNRYTALR